MATRELTCVVCPSGCRITAVTDDKGNITEITGYTCLRGKKYAESEITNPVRTLTSTIPVNTPSGTVMLPVRTDKGIPKASLMDAMDIIRTLTAPYPVHVGDVIRSDFICEGTSLVACKDIL